MTGWRTDTAMPEVFKGSALPTAMVTRITAENFHNPDFDPHDTARMTVILDPQVNGGQTVHLADLMTSPVKRRRRPPQMSGDEVYAATQRLLANHNVVLDVPVQPLRPPTPTTEPDMSLTTQVLGPAQLPAGIRPATQPAMPSLGQPAAQPAQYVSDPPVQYVPAEQQYAPAGQPLSPLAAFRQPAQLPAAVQEAGYPAAAPVRVIFEFDGIGVHQSDYAAVLETPAAIILIARTDSPHAVFWPSAAEKVPPFALRIANRPKFYLVHSTGVRYSFNGYDHCLLMIERVSDGGL